MDDKRTGDLKLIQELNRSIILNMIRECGPISRSEIAKRKKISPTTVASAVKELIQDGLVCEDGTGISNGGRKPIMLKISTENRFLISVSITNLIITVAEMNLEAEVRRAQKTGLKEEHFHNELVIQLIVDAISNFIKDTSHMERCLGISIIIPGIVDTARGVVYYNSKLRLENVALRDMIEERFRMKVWIENDMNAIVFAEKTYGSYSKFHNLLYINVGGGVGAGIVVGGAILRGSRGAAGELGHTSVSKEGIRCECGNVGCLENYVSWPAIRSRLQTLAAGCHTILPELSGGNLASLTPAHFNRALEQQDPAAFTVMEEIIPLLGAGIVNMVNLFNPDVVLLGGTLLYGNDLLIARIEDYVLQHALSFSTNSLDISPSSLGENADLIGAASISLQELFHFSFN